ncbi:auxin response factor 11-like [Cucumis melo var. makuwa]|uniref:Auxin response factor 11-like n=1 Tax=Cucumis melo var. makuwa TaxID=1194695 RepID=A0A5A7UX74_CUCMM|nr:auxin response factor 11-like [Cucumis melo var. makuwa]
MTLYEENLGESRKGLEGEDLYEELWKACAGPLVEVPIDGERAKKETDEVYAQITLYPEADVGATLIVWGENVRERHGRVCLEGGKCRRICFEGWASRTTMVAASKLVAARTMVASITIVATSSMVAVMVIRRRNGHRRRNGWIPFGEETGIGEEMDGFHLEKKGFASGRRSKE